MLCYAECKAAVFRAVALFQGIGFQVHTEKSSLTPNQEIAFLESALNFKIMTLEFTKQKGNEILQNLDFTLQQAMTLQYCNFEKP